MNESQLALMCAVVAVLFACKPNGVSVKDMDATKVDNTTPKCWAYTIVYSDGTTTEGYFWGTEQATVLYLQAFIKNAEYTAANEPKDITYQADGTKDDQSCMDKSNM